MRICVILEGCYPYVTGGVSSWMHQYIQAMPQHEFVVWAINADPSQNGKFRYQLPDNVVEVREVSLISQASRRDRRHDLKFSDAELGAMRELVECGKPDWDILFRIFQEKKVSPAEFLSSEYFLDILTEICRQKYTYTAFSDYFHTIRSMLFPLLYVMCSDVPEADVYHTIATGYAGVLARLGGWKYNVPFILTEHGIYTREREEEIIRANWVLPDFKDLWIRFFYMLSSAAYDGASMVTSLFKRASLTQMEIGADPSLCRFIANGIRYEKFSPIPERAPADTIHIGAILRIAPIKDVKTMLYAFAEVEQHIPAARLFIAGPEDDPEYALECRNLMRQLGIKNAVFMGTINVLEYMGDFDFTIYCDNPNCEREITRSCYDFDVTPEQDEIALAIRDWNDGLSQDDIDLANEKERNRLLLTKDDFNWKPIYANNLIQNGQDGWYAILHAKKDGKFYVCKWSILFQREELEPMYQAQDAETECYILFMERYFDLSEPIIYPEPSEEASFYDVNEYGSFVRAYKTLEEAKSGAIARCGWQGINKDTLEVIS